MSISDWSSDVCSSDLAAEAVKSRIRGLIESETAERVFSDDQLVDLLKAEGIDIARRTIDKYRELMKIQSSVQRHRDKALRMGGNGLDSVAIDWLPLHTYVLLRFGRFELRKKVVR